MLLQDLQFKKIAEKNVQYCPLCGMPQEGFLRGTVTKGKEIFVTDDKWYSFCNCRNIFFTPWENMDQSVYDEKYQEKYEGTELSVSVNAHHKIMLDKIPTTGGKFSEVGVVTDWVLDYMSDKGFATTAIDINASTKTKHYLVVGNLDDMEIPKSDVFWLSHVIEHTKDPINVMRKVYEALNDGGSVYVAMPDTWFIPWHEPNLWVHLHCKEHHILWDMDSFIDMCEEIGFKLHYSKRRAIGADFHVILTKGIA